MVKPGGAIFIGGVRNFKLLEAFHLSVLLHQSPADLPTDQLRASLRKHVQHEKELTIDPDFFHVLKERYPSISDVRIELKGGQQLNELTKFRYDVVLRIGPDSASNGHLPSTDWGLEELSVLKLQQLLTERKPPVLSISNVPNERVAVEARALELLAGDYPPANAGMLRDAATAATGLQPHQFWSLANDLPYTVEITWSSEGDDFAYDVLMRHREADAVGSRNGKNTSRQRVADQQEFSWSRYANKPLRDGVGEQLIPVLRRYMQERVPEYMVPATFMILDHLPLTPNGKLDKRSLPVPDSTRHDPEQNYVEPGTAAEETLARIWCEVLGLEQVGIHDNFFVLGGDSILSIQIVSRAARAGLHLTPKDLFQHQTVAALAAVARTTGGVAAEQGIVTGEVQLTPVQRWFLEREMTDSHHYNQAVMLSVSNLDAARLDRIVKRLVEHHDALRLRFERTEQGWRQWIVGEDSRVFSRVDLSQFAAAEQAKKIETVANEVQASLNLSEGPIARVVLIDLGHDRDQRLLMVIHHLAVDGVSWRILLEDLQSAYEQVSRGAEIRLPAKTTSFREWARQLEQYAQSDAIQSEASHWIDSQRRLVDPLPVDHAAGTNSQASARVVSVALSAEETQQLLHDVPGVYHTQIDDVLLTALARAVSAWTGTERVLVDLEGHGREPISEETDVTRTVGWFTSIYPVLLKVSNDDAAGDSLKAIKEQLRTVPQRGLGYGLLRYLRGDDELSRKLQEIPEAQLSFNYLGQLDQVLDEDSGFAAARESSGESRSTKGEREHLLEVIGGISEAQLHLTWVYSEAIHRRETIERIAADSVKELQEIIRHCQSPQAGGFTPSDFPLAELDQESLDRVMAAMTKRSGSRVALT
jgi:non-ribosomal peptide synthase protein (TIGR01720 family)